MSIINKREVP